MGDPKGRRKCCKTLTPGKRMTVPGGIVQTKVVPAVAVRQLGQALFGMIRLKGSVGGETGEEFKTIR